MGVNNQTILTDGLNKIAPDTKAVQSVLLNKNDNSRAKKSTPTTRVSMSAKKTEPRQCRFGIWCKKRMTNNCNFIHSVTQQPAVTNNWDVNQGRECRYGDGCKNRLWCRYSHPTN